MPRYLTLVYEEEVDAAEQAEREKELPMMLELHAGLREAGLLVGVQRLRSTESATSVRVRGGETDITDGPFAVTKEVLAGYYVLECADFGVDEMHGTNVFLREGDRVVRTYFVNDRGDEALGSTWSYLDLTALGRQEEWEDSPQGSPQTPAYDCSRRHDEYPA